MCGVPPRVAGREGRAPTVDDDLCPDCGLLADECNGWDCARITVAYPEPLRGKLVGNCDRK